MCTHTGRIMPCDHGGRKYKENQAMPCQQQKKLRERHGTDLPFEPSETAGPCQSLDFGLPAPRTMREYVSVVLSHFVGIGYGGLRGLIQSVIMVWTPYHGWVAFPQSDKEDYSLCRNLSTFQRIPKISGKHTTGTKWRALFVPPFTPHVLYVSPCHTFYQVPRTQGGVSHGPCVGPQ